MEQRKVCKKCGIESGIYNFFRGRSGYKRGVELEHDTCNVCHQIKRTSKLIADTEKRRKDKMVKTDAEIAAGTKKVCVKCKRAMKIEKFDVGDNTCHICKKFAVRAAISDKKELEVIEGKKISRMIKQNEENMTAEEKMKRSNDLQKMIADFEANKQKQ